MNLSSSSSLSITPPPFLPSTTKHTCFSSSSSATTRCSFVNSPVSIGVSSPRRLPISLVRKQSKTFFGVVSASSGSRDMTSVTQASGDGDEAPLLDPESYSKPRRIALFVEPSPFALLLLRHMKAFPKSFMEPKSLDLEGSYITLQLNGWMLHSIW
ncbi:hypothetical protein YC2023_124755 [Brassica napus]